LAQGHGQYLLASIYQDIKNAWKYSPHQQMVNLFGAKFRLTSFASSIWKVWPCRMRIPRMIGKLLSPRF